jgi:CRISPR-associated protein Cas5d
MTKIAALPFRRAAGTQLYAERLSEIKMNYGFKVEIWGDYACFSRPELKVERVSYDIMTPSAARGILEAVLWKPAIKYVIDEIAVCAPVRFENLRRNEVSNKASPTKAFIVASENRAQRAAMILRDVRYVVTAHFEMTDRVGERDNEGKFADSIKRRLRNGQNYHTPYLGAREFPAKIRLIEDNSAPAPIDETRSLGLMLYDLEYVKQIQPDGKDFIRETVKPGMDIYRETVLNWNPQYFMANMVNGVIKVPKPGSEEVLR